MEQVNRMLLAAAVDAGIEKARTSSRPSRALGRADFSRADLAPYLVDETYSEMGDTLADTVDLGDPSPEDLARAASRWVRQIAAGNMTGRAAGKFKVFLWRPKGDALLHSARFVARNPMHVEGEEGEDLPLVA
jgi:hypothetical protein